jgi:hypothetical protein
MSDSIAKLLVKIAEQGDSIEFSEVMEVITDNYQYTPTRFSNGELINEMGTNEGSCKLFSFAQLQGLSEQQTLACFGAYYRDDVLQHPQGDDHGNIRNFMRSGWDGVVFDGIALTVKV